MKKRKQNWIKWLAGTVILLLGVIWWFAQKVDFRYTDQEITSNFTSGNIKPRIFHVNNDNRHIRFVEFGADSLPVIILVHGAPSSLNFFSRFYKDTAMLARTMLVGVDRPGYGYSDFGRSVISIKEQARLLQPVIDRYTRHGKKVILAASSYGGSVVAKLAMNNADKISGILFISSSLEPGQEYTIPVVSTAIDSPWFRWFFPTIIQVANDEKLGHRKALEEIQEGWQKIKSRIILLHGKDDGLIYFSNAEYARKKMVNARSIELVPVEGLGHSMMFDKPELIRESLIQLLNVDNAFTGITMVDKNQGG